MKRINRFFENWNTVVYEIQNWFYVRKIIRKHRGSIDWERFGLRADWICRIYTVLNPQLPGDKGDTKEVLSMKYSERMKPINLYLDSIGLSLAIYAAYEEVEDSDSYLVVYSPIFNVITVWRTILFIAFWTTIFITPAASMTWHGIIWLFNLIFN